jgi:hypothetical protein
MCPYITLGALHQAAVLAQDSNGSCVKAMTKQQCSEKDRMDVV